MDAKEFIKSKVLSGISQTDIARKCGISNGTITKILYSETKLTLDTIKKIAIAYGLPLSYFLEDYADPAHDTVPGQPPLTKDEQTLLDMMRQSKSCLLAVRELIRMNDEQRLQWILDQQDKMRKEDA
jgi:transcriptional regulator with XRE-family HTH domain